EGVLTTVGPSNVVGEVTWAPRGIGAGRSKGKLTEAGIAGAIDAGKVGGQDPLDGDGPLTTLGLQVQDKPLGIVSVIILDAIVRVVQVIVVKPPDAEVPVDIQLRGPRGSSRQACQNTDHQ